MHALLKAVCFQDAYRNKSISAMVSEQLYFRKKLDDF